MNLLKIIKKNTKLYLVAFIMLSGMEYSNKPSINHVSAYTIDREIKGVGEVKSNKIIKEREVNGYYKNIQDFNERTSDFIGKTVQTRIVRAYKI